MSSAAEWNLSPLVTSPDVASIQQRLKTIQQDANILRDQYHDTVHTLKRTSTPYPIASQLDEMKWEWTMKPHYYMANYRFYNYPYVFAQLFVYAIYRLYKEQGKQFVPKMKALLSAGSSKSPRELAAEIGFDITKEEFWQKGIDQYIEFINMFEKTLEQQINTHTCINNQANCELSLMRDEMKSKGRHEQSTKSKERPKFWAYEIRDTTVTIQL